DVHQDRAQVRHVGGLHEHVVRAPPADDAPHVEPGEGGQVGPRGVTELHSGERVDDRRHRVDGVDRALQTSDVPGHSVGVDGHVPDARVYGHQVVGPERLGHHRGIGAETVFHQVVRALTALRLTGHARHDEVAAQPQAGTTDGFGGHDDAGQPALHVLHTV